MCKNILLILTSFFVLFMFANICNAEKKNHEKSSIKK